MTIPPTDFERTVDLTIACMETIFTKQNTPSRQWVERLVTYTGFVYSDLLPLRLSYARARDDAKDQTVATVIYLTSLSKVGSGEAAEFFPQWIEELCDGLEPCHACIQNHIDSVRSILSSRED